MTAAGTPAPQVGDTISTAEALDALPVGSVVLTSRGRAWIASADIGLGIIWSDGMGSSLGSQGLSNRAPLTVLFRPDAPQPGGTGNSAFPVADDAVERAARALMETRLPSGGYATINPVQAEVLARAALAAAGARAEVDREVLDLIARTLAEHTGYPSGRLAANGQAWAEEFQRCSACDGRWPCEPVHLARAGQALAARGDAATPTEVEWGVRDSNGVETHYGSGTTAEVASRRILAMADGFALIQRTVSEWREVEGGEQRA